MAIVGNGGNMGIGALGNPSTIIKRRFRWTFEVSNICSNTNGGQSGGSVPPGFVKIAARPNLTIEETELNFLNGRTWIPGKASWETITVTYIDVATGENNALWNWLASVYNFFDPVKMQMGSATGDYSATGTLFMYDGAGGAIERWELRNMWPQAINFGELDYSSSEEANIELTLRYSSVLYQNYCAGLQPGGCWSTCGSNARTGGGA